MELMKGMVWILYFDTLIKNLEAIEQVKELGVSIDGKSLEEKKSLLAKCAAPIHSSKLTGGGKKFFASMVLVVEKVLCIPTAGPFTTLVHLSAFLLKPEFCVKVPIANAIFFCGDRVEGTGNPVIERLSGYRNYLKLLHPNSVLSSMLGLLRLLFLIDLLLSIRNFSMIIIMTSLLLAVIILALMHN